MRGCPRSERLATGEPGQLGAVEAGALIHLDVQPGEASFD